MQYGVTDEGCGMADSPYAVASTIGLLGWRLELRHAEAESAQAVEFLHVLTAGSGDRSAAREARATSTAERHIVEVERAGVTFELTLARQGARGGELAISRAGRKVYRGRLPETLEDDWRYYQGTPHYRLWTTDARYRVLIKPVRASR